MCYPDCGEKGHGDNNQEFYKSSYKCLQVRKITSSGSLPNAEPFLKQASGTVDKG